MSLGNSIKSMLGLSPRRKPESEDPGESLSFRERRAFPRFATRERVRIYLTSHPLSAVLMDISAGGVRISTRHPREVGSEILLEIEHSERCAHLPVKILWDRYVDGAFESGGTFVGLSDGERQVLSDYLQTMAVSGCPAS